MVHMTTLNLLGPRYQKDHSGPHDLSEWLTTLDRVITLKTWGTHDQDRKTARDHMTLGLKQLGPTLTVRSRTAFGSVGTDRINVCGHRPH